MYLQITLSKTEKHLYPRHFILKPKTLDVNRWVEVFYNRAKETM